MVFENCTVIIEQRKNGIQPAIIIIENGKVHIICITPNYDFDITDEGNVGERYDEYGHWCLGNKHVKEVQSI